MKVFLSDEDIRRLLISELSKRISSGEPDPDDCWFEAKNGEDEVIDDVTELVFGCNILEED